MAYRKIQGGSIKNIGALPDPCAEDRDCPRCIGQGCTATSIFSGATYATMEDSQHGEMATFAAGCFWDVEAEFRRRAGVIATRVGYTGGDVSDPTYEQVSSGDTGHVEAVQVVFDPARIPYSELLTLFWSLLDRSSGMDENQRPVIFYHSPEQEAAAEDFLKRVMRTPSVPVIVEVLPAGTFWEAEESHQHYYEKCGQGYGTSTKFWG